MSRWRLYLAGTLVGIGAVTGCARKEFEERHAMLADSVEKFAAESYAWQKDKLFPAICELEAAASIPVPKRLCPGGPGTGGGAPPKPPPFPD
jgi:hypothetical protein